MIVQYARRILAAYRALSGLNLRIDDLKIGQGRLQSSINRSVSSRNLQDYEFKVFSQWGEDGIIQKLVSDVCIENRTFIEFGVEDFSESNCRFLMMHNNWSGFVIDGSPANLKRLRESYYFPRYDIRYQASFITAENINELLDLSGFDADIGLMSIDIDGVDYFVLETISRYRPRILVTEYNSVFGRDRKITVPYEADFKRTQKHHSNLYFGSSLEAVTFLANRKGYVLVGVSSEGLNAFFVRSDLMNDKFDALTAEQAYVESRFREARDGGGKMTYLRSSDRIEEIRGLPVLNVETGQIEPL
ncbi:hypothetical protein KX816_20315 [Sphingosinicellaceae bacterium]|nr:hypothetical protein KX816_20315 [Sphingosinicellaceae bacterium]